MERFIEKPQEEKAKELILKDQVFWNLGHLLFHPEVFWKEMKSYCPEVALLKELSFLEALQALKRLPNKTLDEGLLEKSGLVIGYPVDCFWSDIGSWDNVYEVLSKDERGNVKRGAVLETDSKNCLFLSEKRLITAIGLEDLFVIETKDAILIAKRGTSQRVKEFAPMSEKEALPC